MWPSLKWMIRRGRKRKHEGGETRQLTHGFILCICCSVAKSCLTLCYPMDCSMPGSPVLHYLSEFAQTHVHWIHGYHPTISSSVAPFSSCPQSFPASRSFPVSQLFPTGGQCIRVSASILPISIQGWFPLEGFPGGSDGKTSACNLGDPGLILQSGRHPSSSPGEENGNPLQYSCLENSMDGGPWEATVHGVTKSQTWLSNFTFFLFFPLRLTGLISFLSKGLSRVFSSTTVQKHQFFSTQSSLWSDSHPYMTTGKTIA